MNLRLPVGYVEGKAAQAQRRRVSRSGRSAESALRDRCCGVGGVNWSPSNCSGFTKLLRLGAGLAGAEGATAAWKSETAPTSSPGPAARIPISRRSSHRTQPNWASIPIGTCSALSERALQADFSAHQDRWDWDGLAMQQRADRVRWAAWIIPQHDGGRADHRHGAALGRDR